MMLMACSSPTSGPPSRRGMSGAPLPTQDRALAPSSGPPAASARQGPDPVTTTTTNVDAEWKAFVRETLAVHAQKPEHPFWSAARTPARSSAPVDEQELATRGPTTTTLEEPETFRAPPGRTGVDWRPLVATYFRSEDVDRVLDIIACESSGNPSAWNEQATSHGHATGLLQHLEDYWPDRAVKANAAGYTNGGDIWSAEDQMAVSAWLAYRTPQGFGHWVCNP